MTTTASPNTGGPNTGGGPSGVVSSAARQGALGLAGSLLAGVGGLAITLLVTRVLSTAEAGIYFTAVAAFMICASVLVLGTDTGLLRSLAALRATGSPELIRPTLRIALTPVLLASGTVAAMVFAFAEPLAAQLIPGTGPDSLGRPELVTALRLLAPFLVVATVSMVLLNGASRGLASLRTFTAVQQIFLPAARPILIAVAVIGGGALLGPHLRTAVTALAAWALPLLVALMVAVRAVRRLLPAPAEVPETIRRDLARRFWRETLPRALAATFEIIVVWADVVLVTAIAGPVQGGIYAAASRFVTSGTFAMQAVRMAVGPLLAAAFARGDLREATEVHRLSMRWAMLSTWPVYLAMAAFAPGVLALLGPEHAQATTALTVLAVAMLGVVATGNANTVLNMARHSHWAAVNTGLATVVMLVVDLLLIPRMGILGAAIGWSAAMLTDAVLGTLEVQFGIGLSSIDRGVALSAAVALAGFGLPALLIRHLSGEFAAGLSPIVVLFAGTACAGIVYLALLRTVRRPLGLAEIAAALRRRPGRGGAGHRSGTTEPQGSEGEA